MHTITLLDSCVLNCGSIFHKEVATPDFVQGARSFLEKVRFMHTFVVYAIVQKQIKDDL